MDEFWVSIPNHPDYEINNYGDIRYCDTEILVRPTVNRGYFRVRLDGKRYYVHQLMMLSFYPDDQNGHYINTATITDLLGYNSGKQNYPGPATACFSVFERIFYKALSFNGPNKRI